MSRPASMNAGAMPGRSSTLIVQLNSTDVSRSGAVPPRASVWSAVPPPLCLDRPRLRFLHYLTQLLTHRAWLRPVDRHPPADLRSEDRSARLRSRLVPPA